MEGGKGGGGSSSRTEVGTSVVPFTSPLDIACTCTGDADESDKTDTLLSFNLSCEDAGNGRTRLNDDLSLNSQVAPNNITSNIDPTAGSEKRSTVLFASRVKFELATGLESLRRISSNPMSLFLPLSTSTRRSTEGTPGSWRLLKPERSRPRLPVRQIVSKGDCRQSSSSLRRFVTESMLLGKSPFASEDGEGSRRRELGLYSVSPKATSG